MGRKQPLHKAARHYEAAGLTTQKVVDLWSQDSGGTEREGESKRRCGKRGTGGGGKRERKEKCSTSRRQNTVIEVKRLEVQEGSRHYQSELLDPRPTLAR